MPCSETKYIVGILDTYSVGANLTRTLPFSTEKIRILVDKIEAMVWLRAAKDPNINNNNDGALWSCTIHSATGYCTLQNKWQREFFCAQFQVLKLYRMVSVTESRHKSILKARKTDSGKISIFQEQDGEIEVFLVRSIILIPLGSRACG